jgi:hypothetical protein
MRVLALYAASLSTAFVWGSVMVKKQFWTFLLSLCAMFVLIPNVANTAQATLAWDQNSEPDIGGYKIYYWGLRRPLCLQSRQRLPLVCYRYAFPHTIP